MGHEHVGGGVDEPQPPAATRVVGDLLVGEPGVGKTAVVEGFALRIVEGDVPPVLRNVTLRTLDLALLQAGAGRVIGIDRDPHIGLRPAHERGEGINILVGADAAAPYGGAAFHDTKVWVRVAG